MYSNSDGILFMINVHKEIPISAGLGGGSSNAAAVIKAIKKTLQFVTTEYAITEKKLIEKRGIIRVVYYEMKLDKVENITISQTFFGRLCDYGNLCIQGANFNNIYFEYVDDPNSVKQQINALIDGSEDNN